MANYYGNSKTNYFRVTDEERYQELFGGLAGEDVVDLTKVVGGETFHCVGGDSLDYYDEEKDEYDFDFFLKEMQKILPDNEAFVYMEAGHERFDVSGWTVIVTNQGVRDMSLRSFVEKQAKEMIGPDANIHLECPKEKVVEEDKEDDFEM